MKNIKLIAFDYDGVIVDSFDHNLSVVNAMLKKIGHKKQSTAEDIKNLTEMTFAQLGLDLGVAEHLIHELESKTAAELIKTIDNVTPFEKIIQLFVSLSKQYRLAIISNTTSEAINIFLNKYNIANRFVAVYGGDHRGSKSDKLIELATKEKIHVEQICMVGDAMSDIKAGKQAKTSTVAVTWGFQSEELLKSTNPDSIVHSINELKLLFT